MPHLSLTVRPHRIPVERFLHGTEPFPADNFPKSRPHAKRADQLIWSIKMPHGILSRANAIWSQHHPNTFYGDSYHNMNPESYFEQNLGLVISTSISSHFLQAHNKLRYSKPVSCMDSNDCRCDTSHPNSSDNSPSYTICAIANHTLTASTNYWAGHNR